jgi:ABC-type multidrug transport system fused ATPase/permease subunit
VTFRYAPNAPAAVKDLNLEVRGGEKLGIVGKTGSGKSTLCSLLLRLGPLKGVPPDSGGRILLDGIDIAKLNVKELRRVIGIVPQEPTFFPWNLKENVGEEFSDAEVVSVLELCGLDIRQITGQKDIREAVHASITPGITIGQQQLLMAARALVRRPRIMILDECTAAVDRESADRLLAVLMTHSKDATVLSIAHRLRFVLQSDRILVLGHQGQIIALDTPAKLTEDENNYFAKCLALEQTTGSAFAD